MAATNEAIRFAIRDDARSIGRLNRAAYAWLSVHHPIQRAYIVQAERRALSILKTWRTTLKKGPTDQAIPPNATRPILIVPASTVQFDRASGRFRLPVRNGETAIILNLHISAWHRRVLADPSWSIATATIKPDRVCLTFTRDVPETFTPEAVLALDTNEYSIDGVLTIGNRQTGIHQGFLGARDVQARHFKRRRVLAAKKANDRRVQRRLLAAEGRREHARVGQRLHLVSRSIIACALASRAAIILEDLRGFRRIGRRWVMNRRLSSWPHRELHRQVTYKAALAGVPVMLIDPRNTSKSCPVCGLVKKGRVRAGRLFECAGCGWRCDRQLNAGWNILKTALSSGTLEGSARGLRFDPVAFRRDAMKPLYEPLGGRTGRVEAEGVTKAWDAAAHPPSRIL